jgi:hypothetical protein
MEGGGWFGDTLCGFAISHAVVGYPVHPAHSVLPTAVDANGRPAFQPFLDRSLFPFPGGIV